MTLSYWWMHWFWITIRIYLTISQDVLTLTTHSILLDQKTTTINASSDISHSSSSRAAKAIGVSQNTNPPNNINNISNTNINSPSNNNHSNNNYNNNNNNNSNIKKTVNTLVQQQQRHNISSSVSPIKSQKPSTPKKVQFIYSNMTRGTNTTTTTTSNQPPKFFPAQPPLNKEKSVIIIRNNTNNSLDINNITTDNQMLINSTSFFSSAINQPSYNNNNNNSNNNNIINNNNNLTFMGNETLGFNQTMLAVDRMGPKDDLGVTTSENLSAAGITGITLGCVIMVGVLCGVSYILYRNRGFNRPQVLNDRCSNPDSSGYIDDASVRDNSEEMYSLDNDSFLNSLEAMTIQNYWTDTVKHTKL